MVLALSPEGDQTHLQMDHDFQSDRKQQVRLETYQRWILDAEPL